MKYRRELGPPALILNKSRPHNWYSRGLEVPQEPQQGKEDVALGSVNLTVPLGRNTKQTTRQPLVIHHNLLAGVSFVGSRSLSESWFYVFLEIVLGFSFFPSFFPLRLCFLLFFFLVVFLWFILVFVFAAWSLCVFFGHPTWSDFACRLSMQLHITEACLTNW